MLPDGPHRPARADSFAPSLMLFYRRETDSNTLATVTSGNAAATGRSTHKQKKLSLSGPVSAAERRPSVIDEQGSAFLKLTRVGSGGWESSPLCLVNIILIIPPTSPAVDGTYVCAYTGRFSMSSVVQVCIMKCRVLQPFSHLRFFSRRPSSPLPSHPHALPWNSPPRVT